MAAIQKKSVITFVGKYGFFIALIPFLLIQLKYINFVPIWDGKWYLGMLYDAMEKPFMLNNYNLSGHPSFIYGLLVALTQWIDMGNMALFHILQILIGLIGIYSFYKLARLVFGKKYIAEALVLTLIFAIHPAFLGNSIMPTLDYPATCFALAMLASLLYGKTILFIFFSIFAIFTREAGISIYLGAIAAYCVLFTFRQNPPMKSAADLKKGINQILPKLIPLAAFLIFALYKSTLKSAVFWGAESSSSSSLLKLFLKFDLTNPFTITHLLHIFVVNFNWIFTLFIALYILGKYLLKLLSFVLNKKITYPHKPLNINRNAFYLLLFVFIVNGIVLTNYITFTNIRYRLPLVPYFLVFGLYCFTVILQDRKFLRRALLAGFVPLFFIQNFYSVDKVSNDTFGTFSFGNRNMLCMTSITKEVMDCGRDQRTYNLQYANLEPLVNLAVEKMDLTGSVNIISNFQTHFFLVQNIDVNKKRITARRTGPGIIKPNLYSFENSRPHSPSIEFNKLQDSELPSHLYYLELPVWSDRYFEIMKLKKRGYKVVRAEHLTDNGYSIEMMEFIR